MLLLQTLTLPAIVIITGTIDAENMVNQSLVRRQTIQPSSTDNMRLSLIKTPQSVLHGIDDKNDIEGYIIIVLDNVIVLDHLTQCQCQMTILPQR